MAEKRSLTCAAVDERRHEAETASGVAEMGWSCGAAGATAAPGKTMQSNPPQLTTVRVPPNLHAPFINAQAHVQRHFESLIHQPQQATISIAGERYVLMRAASLSVEFVDLVSSQYQERGPDQARNVANGLLFDLAHAIGKADARNFQQRTGLVDPVARLSAGPIHFAFSGWAYVDIDPASSPTPDEEFLLLYEHPYSFESHSWSARDRQSKVPVCIMNAGYSSGWCEECFGIPLVAAEVECLACGADTCRFVMAPPGRIEAHLARLGYRPLDGRTSSGTPEPVSVVVPEFFQRQRVEAEMELQRQDLVRRVQRRSSELNAANERLSVLAAAVDNAREGILVLCATDRNDLQVIQANRWFTQISGLRPEAAVGNTLDALGLLPAGDPRLMTIRDHVSGGRPFETELDAQRQDGSVCALELRLMPTEAEHTSSERPHWIGLVRDVTRRRHHLQTLRRQATTDPLTGLPNRLCLLERLDAAVSSALAKAHSMALMVMDLDGFKEVNDAFGHPAGDALLEQAGPRLHRSMATGDVVARLGGDEFAVILPRVRDAAEAVQTARVLLDSLRSPFDVAGQSVVVGASIGVALCPAHGQQSADLLRRADLAMYRAKSTGRGVEVYDSDLEDRTPESMALSGELRTAIRTGQLIATYQPQVGLIDRSPDRFEALVRWRHPRRGLLLPCQFLPLIEAGTLIEELTHWMLSSAAAACSVWREAGHGAGVSVNVPSRCLRRDDFPLRVLDLLRHQRLPAEALTIEVTERGLAVDCELASPILQRLRDAGVRIAIDDFGTGFSSLTHLKHLPVDEIKIDRSFVSTMMQGRDDAAIVAAIVQLARSTGRDVVAEGVDSRRALEALRELGCTAAQGDFISRSMELPAVIRWLEAGDLSF